MVTAVGTLLNVEVSFGISSFPEAKASDTKEIVKGKNVFHIFGGNS